MLLLQLIHYHNIWFVVCYIFSSLHYWDLTLYYLYKIMCVQGVNSDQIKAHTHTHTHTHTHSFPFPFEIMCFVNLELCCLVLWCHFSCSRLIISSCLLWCWRDACWQFFISHSDGISFHGWLFEMRWGWANFLYKSISCRHSLLFIPYFFWLVEGGLPVVFKSVIWDST